MLEVKPYLKPEMAVELYKSEKISLSRAAEIAGTSLEGFKDLPELKGFKRVVRAPPEDRMRRGVDLISPERGLVQELCSGHRFIFQNTTY